MIPPSVPLRTEGRGDHLLHRSVGFLTWYLTTNVKSCAISAPLPPVQGWDMPDPLLLSADGVEIFFPTGRDARGRAGSLEGQMPCGTSGGAHPSLKRKV